MLYRGSADLYRGSVHQVHAYDGSQPTTTVVTNDDNSDTIISSILALRDFTVFDPDRDVDVVRVQINLTTSSDTTTTSSTTSNITE